MNRVHATMLTILLANAGCASERLYVNVVDDEGLPVSNATVSVGFSSSHVLFAGGLSHHYKAITDINGNAIVKFDCTTSDIGWHVEAEGYYRGELHREHFNGEDVLIPPIFGFWKLHEHEKRGQTTLYRKKNPQPMYAYSRQKQAEVPVENGRYGFDLQMFDWIPPYGNGKTADLYYVRDRKDTAHVSRLVAMKNTHRVYVFRNDEPDAPKLGDEIGRIEFDEHCGAYVRKQTGNEYFPSTYAADPNAEFRSKIPITIRENNGKLWLQEGPAISKDEYMVIRSRVKCDEQGNIVSANYSKILGPLDVGSVICPYETVFNPRPNDTNLESDPERNLYKGKEGRGKLP